MTKIPYLPESMVKEVLEAVLQIKADSDRAKALAGIVPYLPESMEIVNKAQQEILAVCQFFCKIKNLNKLLGSKSNIGREIFSQYTKT